MSAGRVQVAAVRDAIDGSKIVERFGIVGRRSGRELRTRECPACGRRSTDAVAINLLSGLWSCHVCGGGGDALDLVARLLGLDVRRDFPRVVEIAAEIAGIAPDSDPAAVDAIRRDRAARRDAAEQDARRARADARRLAPIEWSRLAQSDPRGEDYLHTRGLETAVLIGRDVARFDLDGNPCAALHASDGAVINVARRRREPGDGPKVIGLAGCPTIGTLVGDVARIAAGADVIMVEGVADSWAATIAWPGAVVLGAHGASNYPTIARVAAARARAVGARLMMTVDDDATGERYAGAAVEAAIAAGLEIDRSLIVLDLAPHHDLADAVAAGWRP